jgi:hypothetical protein
MQNAQQSQNANMTADRNLLSDKELHYLKDFMSWELLAAKKCKELANASSDQQIRQLLEQTGKKHAARYEALIAHLH